jgi:hypothetical protein
MWLDYDGAAEFCASMGTRLPTLSEVEDGCVANSGCGYDNERIWTSNTAPAWVDVSFVVSGLPSGESIKVCMKGSCLDIDSDGSVVSYHFIYALLLPGERYQALVFTPDGVRSTLMNEYGTVSCSDETTNCVLYVDILCFPEYVGGLTGQSWSYENNHEDSWGVEFFTNAEAQEVYDSGLLSSSLDCNLEFRVQRDNTGSYTTFSFMTLTDGKIFNVNMRGWTTNHQHWDMTDDCHYLKCYDYEQSSPRGYSGYCPPEFYVGTTPQALPVLLLRVNFDPTTRRSGKDPVRNRYTFKGTTYAVKSSPL